VYEVQNDFDDDPVLTGGIPASQNSASQFLSSRSVPKEPAKIARHFNAGKGLEKSSPAGMAEKKRRLQPSLRDLMAVP
jgi:hypothetical protein